MKTLVLAEKPSVGKDIAKALKCFNNNKSYIESDKYIVTWAMGHLVTLASPQAYDSKWENWNLENLPITFDKPKFEVLKETRHQFKAVSHLINRKDVKQIVIATDAGREGELVARLILLKANNKKPLKRLWISSNTNKAIIDGFNNLQDASKYYGLYLSALARSEADFILGINATRALTCKYSAKLSAGRVQTPTLNMINLQDEKVKSHKVKQFFTLSAKVNDITFNIQNSNDIYDKEKIELIRDTLQNKKIKITSIDKKTKTTKTPPLYDLTLLQREANVLYGFSAKHTLDVIQGLYEYHKIVSYPRTDSKYLTSDMRATLKQRVSAIKNLGLNFTIDYNSINYKRFIDDKKVSDHHAIIPTETNYIPGTLNNDEMKIYNLTVKRFISHLLNDYTYSQITYNGEIANYKVKATNNITLNNGFKILYDKLISIDDEDSTQYSNSNYNFELNQTLNVDNITLNSNFTKSPKFLTESTLLAAMENPSNYVDDKNDKKVLLETKGIGTVATRADIIDKLFNSQVIERNANNINITNKGKQLLKVSPTNLKSPVLTAQWETTLGLIEKNKYDKNKFLTEIKKETIKIIENVKTSHYEFVHDNLTSQKCSVCNSATLFSKSKNGYVLTCSDFTCNNKSFINIPRRNQCPSCMKKLTVIGEKFEKTALFCSNCGYRKNLLSLYNEQKDNKSMSKKEVEKLLKKQKTEEVIDSPFANLFKK